MHGQLRPDSREDGISTVDIEGNNRGSSGFLFVTATSYFKKRRSKWDRKTLESVGHFRFREKERSTGRQVGLMMVHPPVGHHTGLGTDLSPKSLPKEHSRTSFLAQIVPWFSYCTGTHRSIPYVPAWFDLSGAECGLPTLFEQPRISSYWCARRKDGVCFWFESSNSLCWMDRKKSNSKYNKEHKARWAERCRERINQSSRVCWLDIPQPSPSLLGFN